MCTDILIPARCYGQVPVGPCVLKKHPQAIDAVPITNTHKTLLTREGQRNTLPIHRLP